MSYELNNYNITGIQKVLWVECINFQIVYCFHNSVRGTQEVLLALLVTCGLKWNMHLDSVYYTSWSRERNKQLKKSGQSI